MEHFIEILEETNAAVIDKFGTTRDKCAEGAGMLLYRLQRAGYTGGRFKRDKGFFGFTQHHWVVDTHTNIIYDPTITQFGQKLMPIDPDNKLYERYDSVSGTGFDPRPPHDTVYAQWIAYRRWARYFGDQDKVTRGADIVEQRVSVKGDPYTYYGFEVSWGPGDLGSNRFGYGKDRAMVVFRSTKGGYNIRVSKQGMKLHDDGRISYPVWPEYYHILAGRKILLRKVNGKWVRVKLNELDCDMCNVVCELWAD